MTHSKYSLVRIEEIDYVLNLAVITSSARRIDSREARESLFSRGYEGDIWAWLICNVASQDNLVGLLMLSLPIYGATIRECFN